MPKLPVLKLNFLMFMPTLTPHHIEWLLQRALQVSPALTRKLWEIQLADQLIERKEIMTFFNSKSICCSFLQIKKIAAFCNVDGLSYVFLPSATLVMYVSLAHQNSNCSMVVMSNYVVFYNACMKQPQSGREIKVFCPCLKSLPYILWVKILIFYFAKKFKIHMLSKLDMKITLEANKLRQLNLEDSWWLVYLNVLKLYLGKGHGRVNGREWVWVPSVAKILLYIFLGWFFNSTRTTRSICICESMNPNTISIIDSVICLTIWAIFQWWVLHIFFLQWWVFFFLNK